MGLLHLLFLFGQLLVLGKLVHIGVFDFYVNCFFLVNNFLWERNTTDSNALLLSGFSGTSHPKANRFGKFCMFKPVLRRYGNLRLFHSTLTIIDTLLAT